MSIHGIDAVGKLKFDFMNPKKTRMVDVEFEPDYSKSKEFPQNQHETKELYTQEQVTQILNAFLGWESPSILEYKRREEVERFLND